MAVRNRTMPVSVDRERTVPRTLRAGLARDELPGWLCAATGLPAGATVAALRPELLEAASEALGRRIELYFCRLLANRQSHLGNVRVADRRWPLELDPHLVQWGRGTHRFLSKSGLIDDRLMLSDVTYGELLAMPGMSPKSIFDFAVATESALDLVHAGLDPREQVELASNAAAAPWADLVSEEDPRFCDLIPNGSGTVADRLAGAASPESNPGQEGWVGLVSALPAILERVALIEQSPLDAAMREYVKALSGLEGEHLKALLGRLGLDGRPARSLPQAVNGARISPERLRQLQVRVGGRLPPHPVYMPALDRALALLADAGPAAAEEIATLLVTTGISTIPFHPASVLAAAHLCGRPATFDLVDTRNGARVVSGPMRPYVPQIVHMASSRARLFGAASVAKLASVAVDQGFDISEGQAREVIALYCDAEFLDADWFWLPGADQSQFFTLSCGILAFASPLDVATIRAGLCRSFPHAQDVLIPPVRVMEAFYRVHPSFEVDARGRVRGADEFDARAQLSKADQIFVDVLRSSESGALDRGSFRDGCLARGMTPSTFQFGITSSAVLDHPARDAWCLVGTRISPGTLAAMHNATMLRNRAIRRARLGGIDG